MTFVDGIRFDLAVWLSRVAVLKIMPKRYRDTMERMYTLGAEALLEELRAERADLREKRDRLFWEAMGREGTA